MTRARATDCGWPGTGTCGERFNVAETVATVAGNSSMCSGDSVAGNVAASDGTRVDELAHFIGATEAGPKVAGPGPTVGAGPRRGDAARSSSGVCLGAGTAGLGANGRCGTGREKGRAPWTWRLSMWRRRQSVFRRPCLEAAEKGSRGVSFEYRYYRDVSKHDHVKGRA